MDLLATATALRESITGWENANTEADRAFVSIVGNSRSGAAALAQMVDDKAEITLNDVEQTVTATVVASLMGVSPALGSVWVRAGRVARLDGDIDGYYFAPAPTIRGTDRINPVVPADLDAEGQPVERRMTSVWSLVNGLCGTWTKSGFHLGRGGGSKVDRAIRGASSIEDAVVRLERLRDNRRDKIRDDKAAERSLDSVVTSAGRSVTKVVEALGSKSPEDADAVGEVVLGMYEDILDVIEHLGIEIPEESSEGE